MLSTSPGVKAYSSQFSDQPCKNFHGCKIYFSIAFIILRQNRNKPRIFDIIYNRQVNKYSQTQTDNHGILQGFVSSFTDRKILDTVQYRNTWRLSASKQAVLVHFPKNSRTLADLTIDGLRFMTCLSTFSTKVLANYDRSLKKCLTDVNGKVYLQVGFSLSSAGKSCYTR